LYFLELNFLKNALLYPDDVNNKRKNGDALIFKTVSKFESLQVILQLTVKSVRPTRH